VRQDRAVANLDDLIGRRVSLRYRLATDPTEPTPRRGPTMTDAVGELASDGPDAVLVHTRRGVVRVLRAAVVAVRAIPPPMPRRAPWAAVARLERLCSDAWPPVHRVDIGDWRLRAADGFTGRANSALVTGDPGVRIGEALALLREFAAEHSIPPMAQVAMDSPWERALRQQGWVPHATRDAGAEVSVLVGELDAITAPPEPAGAEPRIRAEPDEQWWRLVLGEHPATLAQRHVLTAPGLAHTGFGIARRDGVPVAAIRTAIVQDHLYVARLNVLPEHRRIGLATALMGAAARWAVDRGAGWCVLQVAVHNTAALQLYRRLGFAQHHGFRYLRPPPDPAQPA
jgi:GNAT superfamily N-acetyltransferase